MKMGWLGSKHIQLIRSPSSPEQVSKPGAVMSVMINCKCSHLNLWKNSIRRDIEILH